ncbi:MAG: large extracellular alpha-helical protein [Planctomycetota bacterium]|nr:large extracellular alpha-helical protein [Planctomycetota bacterium]
MRFRVFALSLTLSLLLGGRACPAADPAPNSEAKAAVRPLAPAIPPDVAAALQENRVAEAITGLNRMAEDKTLSGDDRDFLTLLSAAALRRAGNLDEARATIKAALAARPAGRWAAKLKGELVQVELAAKKFAAAESLARAAAESALDDARKDRLAGIYRGFANRLLKPDLATTQPDPAGAHVLLEAARGLAKSKTLRAALLREMAQASARAGNAPAAISENRLYLAENPDGPDRDEARFDLGQAQLVAGQVIEARRTWNDLARDLKAKGNARAALRARTLLQVARTFGIPKPPDDAQLALGIAALRGAIDADPGSATAVRAGHEIGMSYLARGKTQEAHDALVAFLDGKGFEPADDAARRERAERTMAAAFDLGEVLAMQAKFEAATTAFETYLTKYPNGPRSADAQRGILDVQLRIAQEHARRERFDKAREVWLAFTARNPLDPRVPGVLFLVGQSFASEKKYDDALAAWEALANRFPGTEAAGHAQYAIAFLYEQHKGDPATAIERFKAITVDPWKTEAATRVAVMENKELVVVTERAFRSGETPKLKIGTRNLETLTFTAYKLDPEAYFRKKHGLESVESLNVGLVAPDAEWKAEVPKYAKFKPIESSYDLKIKIPGVYVVKVTDEKNLQATTLVLGSDIEAVIKTSRDQVLVFAQDMTTGKGRAGARVLLATNEAILMDAKTGPDGVLLRDWDKPLAPGTQVRTLVLDGANAAGTGLKVSATVAQGLSPRAYLDTDRPAYRPGQTVELRGVVREVTEGRYDARPGADYRLEVTDSRGRPFVARAIKLSTFGTFAESIKLDDATPVGAYRVRVYQPGGSEFSGGFQVQTYQLRKIDLTFDLPRFVYYRGETVKGSLIAKYQYGTPLANRLILVQFPDGSVHSGETDASGKFAFEMPTESFADDQILALRAALPKDDVGVVTAVRLAAKGFTIDLKTPRAVYLDGETFALDVTTLDAQGKPIAEDLSVAVLKRVIEAGQAAEREVKRSPVKTDAKTGRGSLPIAVTDDDGGPYILRVSGTDRFGNIIVADRALQISGKKDAQRLRILSDRTAFKVGEEAAVRLVNRGKAGPALITWEADRVLSYKVVPLIEGENALKWTVEGAQFPNVSLSAAKMDGSKFDQARLDATVDRALTVAVTPAKPFVGPNEEVEVEVKTTDQNGQPVAAEVSLALVDEALLRLFNDSRPPIGSFFHDQTRTGAFTTEATNTFQYDAESRPMSQALVDAQEREQAETRDGLKAEQMRRQITKVDIGLTPFRTHGGLGPASELRGHAMKREMFAIPQEVGGGGLGGQAGRTSQLGSDPFFEYYGYNLPRQAALGVQNSWSVGDLTIYSDANTAANPNLTNSIQSFARGTTAPLIVEPSNNRGSNTDPGSFTPGLQVPFTQGSAGAIVSSSDGRRNGANANQPAGGTAVLLDTNGMDSFSLLPVPAERAFAFSGNRPADPGMSEQPGVYSKLASKAGGEIITGEALGDDAKPGADQPIRVEADIEREKRDRVPILAPIAGFAPKPQLPPRQAFIETAYWNPRIVTGKDGTARVKVRAPMSLSRYRFSARGVTGSDTLAGQETAALDVRKPFFVEMTPPAAFTQGDKPKLAVRVHHAGLDGKLLVRLSLYAGEGERIVPKTVDAGKNGVTDVTFEPWDVPEGETVRIEAAASLNESSDKITAEVPIRPWGVEAVASASGASRDDTSAIVGLPAGREYAEPEMVIVVSPSVRRLLVERALDSGGSFFESRCGTMPPNTTSDRASDLLGAAAVLTYLRTTQAAGGPESERLIGRIRGLVSELITLQNEDGGWPWVAGSTDKRASERLATADVVAALAAVEPLGLVPDPKALERADGYLAAEFAKVETADTDVRASLLYGLAARRKAGYEPANALNRVRQGLSDPALAHLALTFAALNRPELAGEILDVLAARAKTENAGPGLPARVFWNGAGRPPAARGPVEATALATLAFARVRPRDPKVEAGAEWLLAHRQGAGWPPHRAQGTVLAALAAAFGQAEAAEDRYKLVISVNDTDVKTLDVAGSSPNATIRVPRRLVKAGGENRVRFNVEGRGRYAFAVALSGFTREFGPDQETKGKSFAIDRREVTPAEPEIDGKAISSGFSVAPGAKAFSNVASQVAPGGRVHVTVTAKRFVPEDGTAAPREFLAIEEHLPAGASLVEGSVKTNASGHAAKDGLLTFDFDADTDRPTLEYDVYGVLPGEYRVLPPKVASVYEPGRYHLGPVGGLKVLDAGEKSTDPYKATPDELYARGKALYDAGRTAEAAPLLESLWGGYALRDDVAKDAARMLLKIFLTRYDPRKVVVYFEILKEKAPDLVISFDEIKIVGRAYGDLGEHERAVLVWRAASEASYLEDARLGETLRQRGKRLEAITFGLELWLETPDSPAIRGDLFGLSQVLATLAGSATADAASRRLLSEAGVTKTDLLAQAIRLDGMFLALAPDDPTADEASLAMLGLFMDRKDHATVVTLAKRFAALYPRSTYLDSFQYAAALAQFHLGKHDQAIAVAEKIASATYKDANGVDQPSPNKWQALYILGQIHDARREPAKAVAYYDRVADRFTDAADAVKALTSKELSVPEISGMVMPRARKTRRADGAGMPAMPPQGPNAKAVPGVTLTYRNVAEVDVKVYPVDLMRLYLDHGNLDEVAGVDLAGITPKHQATVKLGDGKDFADKTRTIELPLAAEGAYLVMLRGDALYASGIVLVSPLALEVLEDDAAGRVRITVRDPQTGAFVPGAQVRIKGSDNDTFVAGETDLRGVYSTEGINGSVTAVVRTSAGRYSFYRGDEKIGTPRKEDAKPGAQAPAVPQVPPARKSATLEENIQLLNDNNRERQMKRLEERHNPANPSGAGVGKFK